MTSHEAARIPPNSAKSFPAFWRNHACDLHLPLGMLSQYINSNHVVVMSRHNRVLSYRHAICITVQFYKCLNYQQIPFVRLRRNKYGTYCIPVIVHYLWTTFVSRLIQIWWIYCLPYCTWYFDQACNHGICKFVSNLAFYIYMGNKVPMNKWNVSTLPSIKFLISLPCQIHIPVSHFAAKWRAANIRLFVLIFDDIPHIANTETTVKWRVVSV